MRNSKHMNPWLIIFTLFCLLGVSQANGQGFEISEVTPRAYSNDSRAFDPIRITFTEAVNAAAIGVDNILVYGSETGRCIGTASYESATQTIVYTPPCAFKEGEMVSVIVNGITSAGGATAPAYQWQFTPRVEYGSGSFNGPIEFSTGVGKEPVALFSADLDGDLYPDLALANSAAGTVSILINQQDDLNRFSQQVEIPVGMRPFGITGGDMNRDGQIDLIVSNLLGNTLTVLLNQGGTSFTTVTVNTGERPKQAEVFDFDNDGFLDIAVAAFGINEIWLHRNNGDATFAAPQQIAVGASPGSLIARDWNNDGFLDLYVASLGDRQLQYLENMGDGTFVAPVSTNLPFSPEALVSGDLLGVTDNRYGDTLVDLAVSAQESRDIWVFQNTGNPAALQPAVTFATDSTSSPALGLVLADIDTTDVNAGSLGKDYDLDLISSHFLAGEVRPFINQANQNFVPGIPQSYPASLVPEDANPTGITASDFDADGDMDLAYVNTQSGRIGVLYNDGGRKAPLRVFPDQLLFGEVCVDEDSTQSVIMQNDTNYPLSLEIFVDPDEGVYTPSVATLTLEPGEREVISVDFLPLAARDYVSELVIRSTLDASVCSVNGQPVILEQTIPLLGRGVQSVLTVMPDTLDFGNVVIGSPSSQLALLNNEGNISANINEYILSDATNFSVLSPNVPATIGAMGNGSIDVSFDPTVAGDYLETLDIVTSDACDSDTLQVVLRATALNPLPDLEPLDLQPIAGSDITDLRIGDQLQLEVSLQNSFFPVDSTFTNRFSVTQPDGTILPSGDVVLDQIGIETLTGLTAAAFTFTQRGDHVFCFAADVNSEVVEQSEENNQLCLPAISVRPMLPDLVAVSLVQTDSPSSPVPILRGQRHNYSGLVRNDGEVDVTSPFQVEIRSNGTAVASQTYDGLAVGAEEIFTAPIDFLDAGTYTLSFFVDSMEEHEEITEENNELVLEPIEVEIPDELTVEPNPFTPNGDSFNDQVTFQVLEFGLQAPTLRIFSFEGKLIRTEAELTDGLMVWDGRDDSGRDLRPGVYLYSLEDNSRIVASGHITLAR